MKLKDLLTTLEVCGKIDSEWIREFKMSTGNMCKEIMQRELRSSEIKILEEGITECKSNRITSLFYALDDIDKICKNEKEYDTYLLDILNTSKQYTKYGRYTDMVLRNLANNSIYLKVLPKRNMDFFKICEPSYKIKVRIDGDDYVPYSEHGNGVEHEDSNIEYFTLMRFNFGENINDAALLVIDNNNKTKVYTYNEIKTQIELGKLVKSELKRGVKLVMLDYIGDCMTAFDERGLEE